MASHINHHEPQGAELAVAARATLEKSASNGPPCARRSSRRLPGSTNPLPLMTSRGVSKPQGGGSRANSVYRILDLFVGANLARRVESSNAYIATPTPIACTTASSSCATRADKTTHIDNDRSPAEVRSAAEAAGFSPVRPVIEVRGKCADANRPGRFGAIAQLSTVPQLPTATRRQLTWSMAYCHGPVQSLSGNHVRARNNRHSSSASLSRMMAQLPQTPLLDTVQTPSDFGTCRVGSSPAG